MAAALPRNGQKTIQELLAEANRAIESSCSDDKLLSELCVKLLGRYAINPDERDLLNLANQLQDKVDNEDIKNRINNIRDTLNLQNH